MGTIELAHFANHAPSQAVQNYRTVLSVLCFSQDEQFDAVDVPFVFPLEFEYLGPSDAGIDCEYALDPRPDNNPMSLPTEQGHTPYPQVPNASRAP